ncbi:DUF2059 domain-containing protein [Pseudorhodoplanes sinuspersici]|nr:DUF2059 domain-containing protein [Pseudorhodoplanes sinuspersici]RKE72755.1 hypothetical protein DFP91_0628 [Pseudorhodoplanes sinuspersici]
MRVATLYRLACASLAALALIAPTKFAQAQQPSPAAITTAGEILDIKNSMAMFDPLVPGVIEQSKTTLLQMNPNLFKDLNEVAGNLRKEYAPRLASLKSDIVKLYAERFTEQELKDTLAFYKSPLGKKILTEEVGFVDRTMSTAQDWAVKLNEEILARFRAEMKKKGHNL